MSGERQPGALHGLRVIELAGETCAWAGKLLADMGADVVLVEPPGGDPTRAYGPFLEDRPGPDRSLHWWHHHTSKRGIVLDLASGDGLTTLNRLIASADVLLESETTLALAALGLDGDLTARHPRLIHCAITPFGRRGPRRDELATDLTVLAAGGVAWMNGWDDHTLPPVRPLSNHGFYMGCHYGVLSILTALLNRSFTGLGQSIDVSLHAAANVTTEAGSYSWLVAGQTVQRQSGRHANPTPTSPTQVLCADGRYVNTGVPPRKPEEFGRLLHWLRAVGLEDEFPEAVFLEMGAERASIDLGLIGRDDEITAIFAAGREAMTFIASRCTAMEFFAGAQGAGLAAGAVLSPDEAYEDPHIRARGFQVEVDHPELGRSFRYPGAPYAFQRGAWHISRRAPTLGEHTAEVLAELAELAGPGDLGT